ESRASDIHIETRDRDVLVKFRIDGALYAKVDPIDISFHQTLISRIKVMSELDIAERRIPQDGRFRVRYKGRTVDFRVSIMPTIFGEDAVIRILDKEKINESFKTLNLDVVGFDYEDITRFRLYIKEPYGMVLVTGPTGSGKTTTLYAALNEIRNEEDKIITIEDPVEYQLHGIVQIPDNEKKGLTFARGLRSILRNEEFTGEQVFFRSVCCDACNHTGYRGRSAIHELLDMSDNIREMIIERRPGSEIRRQAEKEGLSSLRESAVKKVFLGMTTLHE